MLVHVSEVRLEFFVVNVESQDTSQCNSALELVVEVFVFGTDLQMRSGFPKELQTLVDPLDYLGNEDDHIVHCEDVENGPQQEPDLVSVLFALVDLLGARDHCEFKRALTSGRGSLLV